MSNKKSELAWIVGSVVGLGAIGTGCLDRPVEPVEPKTTSTVVETLTQSKVDKIDLLLAIDNSKSMGDKQTILSVAIPDLVNRLINPRCVDENENLVAEVEINEDCPAGSAREFEPVKNIHIGVISSSLGGHGGEACPDEEDSDSANLNPCVIDAGAGAINYTQNDYGHLLTRNAPCNGSAVATYQSLGFLAWDPDAKLTPPGESDSDTLIGNFQDMVEGVGQYGCGYESQLESIYRFLSDPAPYASISAATGTIEKTGTDETLLAQRKDFLRPDSLLAVIMLSDENDCSIKESGQNYFVADLSNPLWRPKAICESDPGNECCMSCAQTPSEDSGCTMDWEWCYGCTDDTQCCCPSGWDSCASSGLPACDPVELDAIDDSTNLRCYHQKQRFGVDFLYPTERYINALTQSQLATNRDSLTVKDEASDTIETNPIFSDLDPDDDNTNIRSQNLVFFAALVGVPWQDIARRDESGQPDLLTGIKGSGEDAKAVGGYMTYEELDENGVWDVILGNPDPAEYVDPTDPLMIESIDARTGTNPITGDKVVSYTEAQTDPNEINGNEYTISNKADLQYACIFPLPNEASYRDCSDSNNQAKSCDCVDGQNNEDNPLCDTNPDDEDKRTLQVKAKAYPGVRQLEVLKGVQSQGIVGSVCPAQLTDDTANDYGYRPAIGAIVDRLKEALGGPCLPRSLTPDENGQVSCLIIEAIKSDDPTSCNACTADGRQEISEEHQASLDAAKSQGEEQAGWNCYCEITQLQGDELEACQTDTASDETVSLDGETVDGWCYVDATTSPSTGNPELVENCPTTERRRIRFVGEGKAQAGSTLFITCSGE